MSILKIWLPISFLYLIFFLWYTNLSGPLSDEEIELFVETLSERSDMERKEILLNFMKEDDGRDFYMINLLDNKESPITMEATGEGATAMDLQAHYMEYMFPEMLKRATHPIFFENVLGSALDILAAPGMENWEIVAIFRYRSRRDLFEIGANPIFFERHDYKIEGLDKTIAIPVETPLIFDVRTQLFIILLAIGLIIDRIRLKNK